MRHRYGWIPDRPDQRDLKRSLCRAVRASLPPMVDLRHHMPPVYDQGDLGSCTGNGIAAAIEYDRKKQGLPDFRPSRLFIYYNERVVEHSVRSDAGAAIRDGIKSVARLGAPPETKWPYDIERFAVKPPATAYAAGKLDCALTYLRVDQTLAALRQCLADGYPVVAGFSVYESFEAINGPPAIVPLPKPRERALGGHCIAIAGYDDARQLFTVRNSWGSKWGDRGYCYMPYAYLSNSDLASDFWSIELVGKAAA